MGKAMFTIISAIAQLERDIIAERVKGGLRRAVERGKKLGRPRAEVNPEDIKRLRGTGLSFAEIAARVCYTDRNGRKRNLSKTQVYRILNGKRLALT